MTAQQPPVSADETGLACADCGLLYTDPGWCDTHIPDEVWLTISPTGDGGGVLCLTCIARRLVAAGCAGIPLQVTSGPWAAYPTPSEPDPIGGTDYQYGPAERAKMQRKFDSAFPAPPVTVTDEMVMRARLAFRAARQSGDENADPLRAAVSAALNLAAGAS